MAGLRFLWRSGRPLWRALVWAYAILFVFFAVTTGAKIYYLAGAYIYLLAAGAVAIDGWLAARAGRLRRLLLATAVTTAVAVPSCCRCCPPATWAGPRRSTRYWPSRSGWPQLVGTVRTAWLSLPPSQRASAVIFTTTTVRPARSTMLGQGNGPAGRR